LGRALRWTKLQKPAAAGVSAQTVRVYPELTERGSPARLDRKGSRFHGSCAARFELRRIDGSACSRTGRSSRSPIPTEIADTDEVKHVLYDLDDHIQIPGIYALMGGVTYEQDGSRRTGAAPTTMPTSSTR
jgi:hypothetical protein